ncbi:uncharacterized protein LOC142343872 [Convolutriloba macropyga]|uniref:uncharacterized protein LOC142343872 n=1 Tax=Convolutriloba macropyga TaxID=536237 RepID=UPI003F51E4C2
MRVVVVWCLLIVWEISVVFTWSAWSFQLAGFNNENSERCGLYSNFYCLILWSTDKIKRREISWRDGQRIWSLASDNYQRLNWFNILPPKSDFAMEDCCLYQGWQFLNDVWSLGYYPEEYIDMLSNYESENKTLISITAKYNETICMNVIQGVLFGTAPSTEPFLLLSDVRGGAGYVTAPLESSFVFLFGPTELEVREMLTFDWFKENYICKDHPEHCK